MAIHYDIAASDRIVFITVPPSIDLQDIKDLAVGMRRDLRFVKNISALIDARELKRAFFVREADKLHKLITRRSAKYVTRYALVVDQDFKPQFSRRFMVRALRHGVNMKTFKDHASALAWLKFE